MQLSFRLPEHNSVFPVEISALMPAAKQIGAGLRDEDIFMFLMRGR